MYLIIHFDIWYYITQTDSLEGTRVKTFPHSGMKTPNFVLSFENNSPPYLTNLHERETSKVASSKLMTTTAVVLRKCVNKRLAEADYKGTKLISTLFSTAQLVLSKDSEQLFCICPGVSKNLFALSR